MSVYQRMYKLITLLLPYCLVTVFVSSSMPAGTARAQSSSQGQTPAGILKVSGSILLNGNEAVDGTTVLSGAQIEARDKSNGTVDLGRLGRMVLGCNSSVRLTFNNDEVIITILSGYAQLIANKGITGTLVNEDGKALKTNPDLAMSSVESTTPNPCGPVAIPVAGATTAGTGGVLAGGGGGGLFGLGTVGTVLLGAGAAALAGVAIAAAARRGTPCEKLPSQAVSNVKACNQ